MSNVNLNLYRIFCKVAQSKSYSEAAEKLRLSVPNISVQISNLEEQLNLKLFNRENKGVTLTEDGKELYDVVNKAISGFDFAEKLAKDKNDISSGNIRIGCPSHLTSYFLMKKIEEVKKDFPKLGVTIICEVDNEKMLELLKYNSYWLKDLNRDPSSFKRYKENMKIKYRLRATDKISDAIDNIDIISNVLSALK